jgi:hypothetical protein
MVEMRAAVLHLAFAGLSARDAVTDRLANPMNHGAHIWWIGRRLLPSRDS